MDSENNPYLNRNFKSKEITSGELSDREVNASSNVVGSITG